MVELHEIGKDSYLEVIPNAPSILWNFISSHHSNHLIQMKAFGLDGGVLSFTNSYKCIKATK
ncbi:MAG: hypothetical protein CES88_02040 [Halobacteriovorax sp. JY17]|nr:MAG: hypothetical protein CES88_02040 [Halobacteriovorax sp. JY17]